MAEQHDGLRAAEQAELAAQYEGVARAQRTIRRITAGGAQGGGARARIPTGAAGGRDYMYMYM